MFLPTAKPVYLVRECGEFIAEAELEDARLLSLPSETVILLLHVFVQHLKPNQRILTLHKFPPFVGQCTVPQTFKLRPKRYICFANQRILMFHLYINPPPFIGQNVI